MRVEGQPFEIKIIGEDGKAVAETAEGHIGLAHDEQYKIFIRNESDRRAGIDFVINGIPFRPGLVINANTTAFLDVTPENERPLMCYAPGSNEAMQAGNDVVDNEAHGTVLATIYREKPPAPPGIFSGWFKRKETKTKDTGLSNTCNRRFSPTTFTKDLDAEPVTISLKLVHDLQRKVPDAHAVPGCAAPAEKGVTPPVPGTPK